MSIPVQLDGLSDALKSRDWAYLLTNHGDQRAPHAVAVTPSLDAGRLRITGVGRRSRANAQARAAVALVWPPLQSGDYSLIVDGQASVDEDVVWVVPSRAVLHRSASPVPAATTTAANAAGGPNVMPAPTTGSCAADCIELDPGR